MDDPELRFKPTGGTHKLFFIKKNDEGNEKETIVCTLEEARAIIPEMAERGFRHVGTNADTLEYDIVFDD